MLTITTTIATLSNLTSRPLIKITGWSAGIGLVILLLILFVLYLQGAFYNKIDYKITEIPDLEDPHFPLAMMGVSNSHITQGDTVGYWFDIDTIYAKRLEAIAGAEQSIHFETFYMTPGRRADEFAEAICDRARAGVEVKLLIDSFGASSLSNDYWKQFEQAGVSLHFFHQFSWKAPLTYNIRTHRKLLLIDGNLALVGGTGVSDHWDGMESTGDQAPWLDFEVAFKGTVVAVLEGVFMQHWIYTGGVAALTPKLLNPISSGDSTIIVTPSEFPCASSSVCALFYSSVLAAKKRLWIASPYFLPDANARKAMIQAKKRGVDVRVLTVGPHNDKQFVYYAVRERYQDLLLSGVEIYEYQLSMMHAKVLLIDNDWISTGSANFDPRSLFHNDELNLSLADPPMASFIEEVFQHACANSHLIKLRHWRKRPIWQRLLGQLVLTFRWQL